MVFGLITLVAAWDTVSLITGRASVLAVICPGAISIPSKLVWCRGSVDPGSTAISAVARVLKIDHDDSSVELSDVITTMLLFLVFPYFRLPAVALGVHGHRVT